MKDWVNSDLLKMAASLEDQVNSLSDESVVYAWERAVLYKAAAYLRLAFSELVMLMDRQMTREANDVAEVPRSGGLARLIRRAVSHLPVASFSVEDQEAMHHLANLVECQQCKAPYDPSGECKACGREWGRK